MRRLRTLSRIAACVAGLLLFLLVVFVCLWPRHVRAAFVPTGACTLQIAVNQTTSTDLKTFTNKAYICYVFLISATAQNVSLVQGTGSVCATSTVALIGGTTASAALAANGGFVVEVAPGGYVKMTTTAQHLCLLQSGSGNISGVIGYIDAP